MNNSTLEETTEQIQFERGQSDAQRGFPPREGSNDYLIGYAERFNQIKCQREEPVPIKYKSY